MRYEIPYKSHHQIVPEAKHKKILIKFYQMVPDRKKMKKYEISNPKQSLSPDGSRDTMLDTACDFLAPDLRPVPPQVSSDIIMYHQLELCKSFTIRYHPFSS